MSWIVKRTTICWKNRGTSNRNCGTYLHPAKNDLLNKLVFLALVSLSLAGCTVGGVDVEQEQASGLAGELLDGHTFGQTFTLQYDGLYRVDLYTAT